MPLTVSNNSAVASASYYLDKNQKALQHSIKKLASGKRIIAPNEDPGTLSVVMKLNASVQRMKGAKNNVQNGISFAEVQDGMLETIGRMVSRMAELKGMATQDPMKSSQDVESYNNEFRDLQKQLRDISKSTFNGVSLFADFAGTKEGLDASGKPRQGSRAVTLLTTSLRSTPVVRDHQVQRSVCTDLLYFLPLPSMVVTWQLPRNQQAVIQGLCTASSQEMTAQQSRSAREVYPWAFLSRQFPILLTFVHKQVAECPGSTSLQIP